MSEQNIIVNPQELLVLRRQADCAAAELKDYREKFERIEKLCHEFVDSYYTLKVIQKMAEETNRLARQKEFL